ncbi:DUF4302 domain-containing protein [Pedobacter jeongneungensis]|uniref:DUF4302 domain-containing protein n=1 Tax=Pedobacter jeongneungensis TaxID=947309 RepID=UPI000468E0ED|nr:DUF4302 domain-containing protein [Pedobacter jeongneungensis]
MKKYILYALLSVALFNSCKKGIDPGPGERPEERTEAALTSYKDALTGNTNGWKALLFPSGGGVYLFSMKFGTNDRVNMISDFTTAAASTSAESGYRLRLQQAPTLLFDTYSYIHLLADPDPSVAGGQAGNGYKSDFEFYFDKTSGDTIKLIGNRLGSKLFLVKAKTAAEYDAFPKGTNDVLSKLAQLRTYFKRTTIGGVECEVKVDPTNKQLIFTYYVNGAAVVVTGAFYVDGTTMVFLNPITIGTATISQIKDTSFDATNRVFAGTINGTAFSLNEAIAPLKFDATAAQKWYNQKALNFNDCWVSDKAFHANGVDDFCNFRSVPGYTNLWYAGASVFGGANDGLIAFTTGLVAPYAFSVTPVTVVSGIARFTLVSSAGTFTGTAPLAVSMTAARALLYGGATAGSSQDWYLISTSPDGTRYDMVRKSDAQAWISWRPR